MNHRPLPVTVALYVLWAFAAISIPAGAFFIFISLSITVPGDPVGGVLAMMASGVFLYSGVALGTLGLVNGGLAWATRRRRRWAWIGIVVWFLGWFYFHAASLDPRGLLLAQLVPTPVRVVLAVVCASVVGGYMHPSVRSYYFKADPSAPPLAPRVGRHCLNCGMAAAPSSHVCSQCRRLLPRRPDPAPETRNG